MDNTRKVAKAFAQFGLPMHDFTLEDLADTGFQFHIGVEPIAFDFLTTIKGLEFEKAWQNRQQSDQDGTPI